jgi:acetoacetate decarboxylase
MRNKNWRLGNNNSMPILMGEGPVLKTLVFPDNLVISVTYLTEMDALTAMLPPNFRVDGDPVVSFVYRQSRDVAWTVGGVLNLMGMSIPAVFEGRVDRRKGTYWPAVWENDAMAVVRGREIFGVPELHAEITDPVRVNDSWRARMSEAGGALIEIEIAKLSPIKGAALAGLQRKALHACVLGWKYIPTPDARGADLEYATHYLSPTTIEEAWAGKGAVKLHQTDADVNIWSHHIMETLGAIPLLQYLGAVMWRGSVEHKISRGRKLA